MWDLHPLSTQLMAGNAGEARGLLQATQPLCPCAQASTSFCGVTLKSDRSETGEQVTPESRHRVEDGERKGQVLGKNYQAFAFPPSSPCSGCCWLCVTWKTDWDHSLPLMWKCSLLVRAGSPCSAAELSGEKDEAVGDMSAFHFPRGKPSPAGQDSEEREQATKSPRAQNHGQMSL